jgi:peptide/nickel transport system substrate-binding protein
MKQISGNPALDAFLNGDVDMIKMTSTGEMVDYLKNLGFARLNIFDSNGYQYMGLNLRLDKFKDKRVRQALLYGLDRQKFIDEYYSGYASTYNTAFPKCSWASPEDGINDYKYDLDKAKKLMDDAGWTLKEDGYRHNSKGEKFTIKWSTYEGSKYVEKLTAIALQNWKDLGVEVVLEKIPFNDLVKKVYDKREFEMYNMSWNFTKDPDPSNIFLKSQDISGGYNAIGWRNDKSDELILKALKTSKMDERKNIYYDWAKLTNEELPYLFSTQSKDMYVTNSRVKNLKVSPFIDWTSCINSIELK